MGQSVADVDRNNLFGELVHAGKFFEVDQRTHIITC